MPRPEPPIDKTASGLRTVTYRDTNGRTWDSLVVGGTGTTLDLEITSQNRRVTGVERGSAAKAVNVWF